MGILQIIMYCKTIILTTLASYLSFSYGADFDASRPFSATTQTEELIQWTSSTKADYGTGLWVGNGFSFNLKKSAWLSMANTSVPLPDKVLLNSIAVKTRTDGRSPVSDCYAYLCTMSGTTMTVLNKSNTFNAVQDGSTFTFNFSQPSIIDSNTTYAIVYSKNGTYTSNSTITLGDGIGIGMTRTSTSNPGSSEGQLFSGNSLTPSGENYAPHVTISTSQVPEPVSAMLLVLGGIGFSVRRRRA